MKKLIAAAAVAAAVLTVTPGHAITSTARIAVPVAGTYAQEVATQDYAVRCRDNMDCVPKINANDPAAQKPVSGDVTIERGSLSRGHRCLYTFDPKTAQSSGQGILGYTIDVTSARGRPFTLKSTSANTAPADFDITFYSDFGTCAGGSTGPGPSPADPENFSSMGDESGRVPNYIDEATNKPTTKVWAIVTLFSGAPDSQFQFKTS